LRTDSSPTCAPTLKNLRRTAASRRSLDILIIDDDVDYLSLVASQLERHLPGATIRKAFSPEEAVVVLSREHFSLVVCDWAIAAKTAPEVFKIADPLAKAIHNGTVRIKVPVMFMSGSEKVSATQRFIKMENFEAVSFMLKRLGPSLIGVMAENILHRFQISAERNYVYLS
jgi:DNA-binding NtrC family response regulator